MCLEDISVSVSLIDAATQAKWQNSSLLRFCTASRRLDRRVLGRPGADVAATQNALNELLQGGYQHRPEVAHLSRHYFSSHAVLGGADLLFRTATAEDI